MAKNYIVAGQVSPAAATVTDLYTVPAGKEFIASSLIATNRSSSVSETIQVYVTPDGQTRGVANAIIYDMIIPPRGTKEFKLGLSLPPLCKVEVRALGGDVSFHLFGCLMTPEA